MFKSLLGGVDKEERMEALKSSMRPEVIAPQESGGVPSEETMWVVENGGFMGDGFAVDEFLDLGEFGNDEKEAEEDIKEVIKDSVAEADQMETENNNSDAVVAPASSSPPFLSFGAPLPPLSEISLSPHDAQELEWVSFIIDDSCSDFPTSAVAPLQSIPKAQTQRDDSAHRETQHPHVAAGVTKGASCPWSMVNALSAEAPVPARAKRSKRSRTATFSWSSLPFTESSSSSTTTAASSASCSSATSSISSCLIYDYPAATNDQSLLFYESHRSLPLLPFKQSKKQKVPKKRGRKPKHPLTTADAVADIHSGEQRCSHCGVKKTPQWRAGPLGAKTLCNACGVRYKSGRLLPEYRPACSPTFQNAIHSNSHRKVLEMRRKKEEELLATAGPPPIATC